MISRRVRVREEYYTKEEKLLIRIRELEEEIRNLNGLVEVYKNTIVHLKSLPETVYSEKVIRKLLENEGHYL